jgi:lysophospholipase L1-like esterase
MNKFKDRGLVKYYFIILFLGIIWGIFNYNSIAGFTNKVNKNEWELVINKAVKELIEEGDKVYTGLDAGRLVLDFNSKVILKVSKKEGFDLRSMIFDVYLRDNGIAEIRFREEKKGNYYTFMISNFPRIKSGFYKVKRERYELARVGNGPTSKIKYPQWRRVKIDVEGDIFKAYLDGKLYETYNDSEYNSGLISLCSRTAPIMIDNFEAEGYQPDSFRHTSRENYKGKHIFIEDRFENRLKNSNILILTVIISIFSLFIVWLLYSLMLSQFCRIEIGEILRFDSFTYSPIILLMLSFSNVSLLSRLVLTVLLILVLKWFYLYRNKEFFIVSKEKTYGDKLRLAKRHEELRGIFSDRQNIRYLIVMGIYGFILYLTIKNIGVASLFWLAGILYIFILLCLTNIKIDEILRYDMLTYLPIVLISMFIFINDFTLDIQINSRLFLIVSIIICLLIKFSFVLINNKYFKIYNAVCLCMVGAILMLTEMGVRATSLNRKWSPEIEKKYRLVDWWIEENSLPYQQGMQFKGIAHLTEKDKNTFRIISLGDSVTWGWPIENPEDVYPAILETVLNEYRPERRYEVINAGVVGWTSFQGLACFKKYLLRYHPDLVLISFGPNDCIDNEDEGLLWTDKEYWSRINSLNKNFTVTRLLNYLDRIRLYRGLKRFISYLKIRNTSYEPNYRVPLEDFKENLEEFIRVGEENNIKVLFMYVVYNPLNPDAADIDKYYRVMEAVAKENRIGIVDTITLFEKQSCNVLFLDLDHPTELGHRLIAEEIYKTLIGEKLILAEKSQIKSM